MAANEAVKRHLKALEAKLTARLVEVKKVVDQNQNVMKTFMSEYERTRELDLYAFADQSERSDYGSNLLKANCVLITGTASSMYEVLGREIVMELFAGLKTDTYPKEAGEQNAKAVGMIKELMMKVLGREEEFSLTIRKSTQQRFAKDSKLILVPPIEVIITIINV